MTTKHRDIYDIIRELREHPQFVEADIWTKNRVIDEIVAYYETDFYVKSGLDISVLQDVKVEFDYDDFTDRDWLDFGCELELMWDNQSTPHFVDGELKTRLNRKIKLDNLL